MTPAQYATLEGLNTRPDKSAPPRVSKYAARCKELLLAEFKTKH